MSILYFILIFCWLHRDLICSRVAVGLCSCGSWGSPGEKGGILMVLACTGEVNVILMVLSWRDGLLAQRVDFC